MAPITFEPFAPAHLDLLAAFAPQTLMIGREDAAATAAAGFAWSGFVAGEIAGVAGVTAMPNWPGRAHCWLIRGPGLRRRDWPAITNKVREVLAAVERAGIFRMEVDVRDDFPAGRRWAGRLGFAAEALRRRCAPDGASLWLYARVVEG